MIEEFAIQHEKGTLIGKERKDWQCSTTRLHNGRLKKCLLFNVNREHFSIKKEKIGNVELQDNIMGDYKRVC